MPESPALLRTVWRLAGLAVGVSAASTLLLGFWITASGVSDVRGVDLNVLYTLMKWALGAPLYTDPASAPFDVAQYGPLFYLLVRAVASPIGTEALTPAILLALARATSLVLGLIAVGVMARIAMRWLDCRVTLAAAAGGVSLVLTAPWFFVARPDALSCVLQIAVVWCLCVAVSERGMGPAFWHWIATAVLTATLATLAKQTAVISLAIIAAVVLWSRGLRLALLTMVGGVVAVGGVYVLAMGSWPALPSNVIGGVSNGINIGDTLFKAYPILFLSNAWIPATLAAIGLTRETPLRPEAAVVLLGFWAHVLWGMGTSLKAGAAENYFNEAIILGVGVLASEVSRAWRSTPDAGAPPRVLALGLVLVVMLSVPIRAVHDLGKHWYVQRAETGWGAAGAVPGSRLAVLGPTDSLAAFLRNTLASQPNRYFLSFDLLASVAVPEHALVPQREVATILADRKIVAYEALRDLFNQQAITYVISENKPPVSFLGIPLPPLHPERQFGRLTVYRVVYNTATPPAPQSPSQ